MTHNTQPPPPEGSFPDTSNDGCREAQQGNPAELGNGPAAPMNDPTEALKRELEKYRLPADVKEQILAQLPSPEEMERQHRELMEKGGLSFEECFGDLLAEFEDES